MTSREILPFTFDPPANRRTASRRRVLKGGRIHVAGLSWDFPCMVRDLSETGARLAIDENAKVPARFELTIDLDGMKAQCEIVWRNAGMLGVRFLSTPRQGLPTRIQVVEYAGTPGRPFRRGPIAA